MNSIRMEAGKPPLFSPNLFLYSLSHHALHDITAGDSRGCQGINLQSGKPVPSVIPIPYCILQCHA